MPSRPIGYIKRGFMDFTLNDVIATAQDRENGRVLNVLSATS